MDLIQLKRKISELTSFINYQKKEIEEAKNTLKSSQYTVDSVSGGNKKSDISDVIEKIVEMETELEKSQQEYNRIIPLLKDLERVYEEYNDRDKMIFLEHYCKGYSTVKIGMRYGITDRQVRNILHKTNKKIKNETLREKNKI